jgi:surfactin synthase thioesterase subunit
MTQERAGAMQGSAPARERALAVAGGEAYRRDVPRAEGHLFEGGHFLLEEHAEPVATLIRVFLGAQRNAPRR